MRGMGRLPRYLNWELKEQSLGSPNDALCVTVLVNTGPSGTDALLSCAHPTLSPRDSWVQLIENPKTTHLRKEKTDSFGSQSIRWGVDSYFVSKDCLFPHSTTTVSGRTNSGRGGEGVRH